MNNEEQPLHIKEEEGDTIEIWLTKEKTPAAYERKKYELIHKSGMTEQEAEEHIAHIPIVLEVFYSVDQGLFGVKSEAIASCKIYNPYSGEEIPNDNLI
ncbi:hypothetical protein [Dysgonomonas termitidis]|uniref:Multi-ubiquitin domain-containing protein n=1 Tax=Dysgonomonas termitidis TaxID=1516126 RepID=A0ABV9KSR4_9BACT